MLGIPQLHSFSVGLEGSPDLAAAQIGADHIGTIHHEIKFTIQEGLDAVKDVIYNLEI
jgi:asparagine synthase (glutamine-hydrolysing)